MHEFFLYAYFGSHPKPEFSLVAQNSFILVVVVDIKPYIFLFLLLIDSHLRVCVSWKIYYKRVGVTNFRVC